MELELRTVYQGTDGTFGTLGIYGENPKWVTIERPYHYPRIEKKSCIYQGRYRIIKREHSPKVDEYKRKHPWFQYHFELENVPDAKHILMHIANYLKDIEGCIGVAYSMDLLKKEVHNSTLAFKELSGLLYEAFDEGEENYITVRRLWWNTPTPSL